MSESVQPRPVAAGEMEFWFEFGSNYSYLSLMRIKKLCNAAGVRLHWKPFLLGPIFKSFGWDSSPFVLQELKGRYVWRDMERQCAKYDLPWNKPSTFPRRAILPMRVATLGVDEPWMEPFCQAVMQQNFVHDQEVDSVEAVTQALEGLDVDAQRVIALAQGDENKLALRRNTEDAVALGLFGAPMFRVGDEIYWGNDRLEDAIAAAQSHVHSSAGVRR